MLHAPRTAPWRRAALAVGSLVSGSLLVAGAAPSSATTTDPAAATAATSWSAYLHGPRHSSAGPANTAITRTSVAALTVAWTWKAPGGLPGSSPVTAGGSVFLNAGNGSVFALNEATGAVRWHKDLGLSPCGRRGSVSSATVAPDPVGGAATLYIAGADNFLYALDPATGATRWRSVVGGAGNAFYTWGSPTVAGGKVYMAVSSACGDTTHGGAAAYDQHTGALLSGYQTGAGSGLPTVYTSPAADGTDVYVTTGDSTGSPTGQDNDAVVRLSASTLTRQEAYLLPSPPNNSDYNASPAFFPRATATGTEDMVGVCNKDGVYRAFRAGQLAAGPAWTRRVGLDSQQQPDTLRFCGGSSAYDSLHQVLLQGSNQQSLTDRALGSVYSLNPQTGAVRWRTSLAAGPVIGSVSVNGSQVVAAPTYDAKGGVGKVYLLDEATGKILRTLPAGGPVFAQPTWSADRLLVAAGTVLTAWR